MRPEIIIDGYNFILRTERIRGEDEHAMLHARSRFLQKLMDYAQLRKVHITVVFDGQAVPSAVSPERRAPANVRVLFSKPPQSADSVIKNLIQKHPHPRNVTIVTSDQPLARFCRTCGGQQLEVVEFYNRLQRDRLQDGLEDKYNYQLSSGELDEWLQLFEETTPDDE